MAKTQDLRKDEDNGYCLHTNEVRISRRCDLISVCRTSSLQGQEASQLFVKNSLRVMVVKCPMCPLILYLNERPSNETIFFILYIFVPNIILQSFSLQETLSPFIQVHVTFELPFNLS